MSSPFDASYTLVMIRFWRVRWHREALNVLAEAVSPSAEADYLTHEWTLIQSGNRAEFKLRHEWDAGEHGEDAWGWRDSPTWHQIGVFYGPPAERRAACLCKWLHDRPYPTIAEAHGGNGDAGGRARRLIADLDSAVASLVPGQTERQNAVAMARSLGWLPREPEVAA